MTCEKVFTKSVVFLNALINLFWIIFWIGDLGLTQVMATLLYSPEAILFPLIILLDTRGDLQNYQYLLKHVEHVLPLCGY